MEHKEEFRTVFHRVLSIPFVYELVQTIAGSNNIKKAAMELAFNENRTYSFLDLGCGTGEIIRYIPPEKLKRYVGLDVNSAYIKQAKEKFSNPAYDFYACEIQNSREFIKDEKFDLIYLGGFLHHLNDQACTSLLSFIPGFMAPGARAITMDPIFFEGQSYIARKGASMDRGKYVREAPEYLALHQKTFKTVKPHIFHKLMRYPHTIQITECQM